jgi:hypothetical protein
MEFLNDLYGAALAIIWFLSQLDATTQGILLIILVLSIAVYKIARAIERHWEEERLRYAELLYRLQQLEERIKEDDGLTVRPPVPQRPP